jgi:hypothetical protein
VKDHALQVGRLTNRAESASLSRELSRRRDNKLFWNFAAAGTRGLRLVASDHGRTQRPDNDLRHQVEEIQRLQRQPNEERLEPTQEALACDSYHGMALTGVGRPGMAIVGSHQKLGSA